MQKNILITGSTDGIGLATAKMLTSKGHKVLLHGRNPSKLDEAKKMLSALSGNENIECYKADLSCMREVEALAGAIVDKHQSLDVLINNAGILRTPNPITNDCLDIRFAVNSIAPYLLAQRLLPLLKTASGRVINLSSAAQASVNLKALTGQIPLTDEFNAYAQSKLALTIWSRSMALASNNDAPVIIAVNPGSMLGSKMVSEGFGVAGGDIDIGAKILVKAALSDEFANASGKYFDNDSGQFASPHMDALDPKKCQEVVGSIEAVLNKLVKP